MVALSKANTSHLRGLYKKKLIFQPLRFRWWTLGFCLGVLSPQNFSDFIQLADFFVSTPKKPTNLEGLENDYTQKMEGF